MKRALFSSCLLAAALCSSAASAQTTERFDVQSFTPAPAIWTNYINLHRPDVIAGGDYELALVVNYANDPLVFETNSGDRTAKIVQNFLSAHLLGAYGIGDRIEIGVDVPIVLVQDSDVGNTGIFDGGSGAGIGDIRVVPKVEILGPEPGAAGVSLGVAVGLTLPTGDRDGLQGGGFGASPSLLAAYTFAGGTSLGVNVGGRIRSSGALANLRVDDALTYGVAASVPLDAQARWRLVPELRGEVAVGVDGRASEEAPLEALLAAKFAATERVGALIGGGTGLVQGVGAPDYRLFAGVSLHRPPPPPPEHCAAGPEDIDGFQDDDRCVDPDNDNDGLLDAADACPDRAEDFDGFEDEDGCPDPDNDNDGVRDTDDACPETPEDVDGFEDRDGCPDPDNDADGLLDADDACPDEAEDFDGEDDEDGCPEDTIVTCTEIVIDGAVHFPLDSDVISQESYGLLDDVARTLAARPEIARVEVAGHTDNQGEPDYNLDLSQRRAAAVVAYLVDRGIEAERLVSAGYGETQPVDTNDTEQGMARNRRVQFLIQERTDGCAE